MAISQPASQGEGEDETKGKAMRAYENLSKGDHVAKTTNNNDDENPLSCSRSSFRTCDVVRQWRLVSKTRGLEAAGIAV